MVIGSGVDLFDVARIEARLAADGPAFAASLFTPAEIADCTAQRRPAEALALRFAAKEAFVKALAAAVPEPEGAGLPWRDIRVRAGPDGQLDVVTRGAVRAAARRRHVGRVLLSVARARGVVAALVVLEAIP